jgi:hypothetical protein
MGGVVDVRLTADLFDSGSRVDWVEELWQGGYAESFWIRAIRSLEVLSSQGLSQVNLDSMIEMP